MAANSYQNLGILHHELNDLKNAQRYYTQALSINQKLHNQPNTAALYQNLGLIYYRNKEYETALQYFDKSLVLYTQQGDTSNVITSYSIHYTKLYEVASPDATAVTVPEQFTVATVAGSHIP